MIVRTFRPTYLVRGRSVKGRRAREGRGGQGEGVELPARGGILTWLG